MIIGGAGAMIILVAGCNGGDDEGALRSNESAPVTITPANGTGSARPDSTIEVKAAQGRLQDVTVQGSGVTVTGQMGDGGKVWRSTRTMSPGAKYTVTARSRDGAKTITTTSAFTTGKGKGTFSIIDVTPGIKGEKVGVGMPIMVRFSRPVTDKAAVERVLKVTPEKPVEGAWRWMAPDQAIYRTRSYWSAHQKIQFSAQLAGVQGAKGVFGSKDTDHTIEVGAAQITTGNIGKYRMTVTRDGRKLRTVPFSAGNGQTREFTTTSGVHLLMEKGNPVKMISPGRQKGDPGYYETTVNHAVRFSNSGEYTHSAPWSVGSQGNSNVSHGCLNLSPGNARWYYDIMQRGDVLKLTGSRRDVEYDNGWSYWQMSFEQWRKGSALA